MTTLAELLSYVVTALQESDSCREVRVVETHSFSARQFAFKVRAAMITGETLQVRIYHNGSYIDYSYQLLRDSEHIMRWDNKEHFPAIDSYPHHIHTITGEVIASTLTGELEHDLSFVLSTLSRSTWT